LHQVKGFVTIVVTWDQNIKFHIRNSDCSDLLHSRCCGYTCKKVKTIKGRHH